MRFPHDRRGAALPLAILVICLLSIGALGGLMRLTAERRITANLSGQVDAWALAQAGLSRYLAGATTLPPVSLDTLLTGIPGGNDSIAVRQVRPAGTGVNALYVIVSTAIVTGTRYDARTPAARRKVAQFASWQPGSMNVTAAWASTTGITKNGGSGTISGTDQCGSGVNKAGVSVPTTDVNGNPGYDQNGGSPVPTGSPPISYPGPNKDSVAATIRIDWNGIVNGNALTPTYALTGTSGWPSSFTNWPIIKVTAASLSLTPAYSGRGLLIVTGDLAMSGSFSWDGVILVGGALTSNGNNTVQGAIVSGLNVKLGQTVPVSDAGNGTKTIRYNSCYVSSALTQLGGLVPVSNGWTSTWPAY